MEDPTRAIVTFVRHGECVIEGADPDRGGPLTPRGREQARAVGAALARCAVGRIIASDLPRTGETAVIIAGVAGLQVEFDPRVRECVPPLPPDIAATMGIPPGQTGQAKAALDSICAELFRPGASADRVVVVSHGNAIRYLLCRAMGWEDTLWTGFELMNHCAASRVATIRGKPPRISSYNDTRGIPEDLLTR